LNHELDIYIELYKRGAYDVIPLGAYPNGEYFYPTKKQIEALELLNNDETSFVGYGGSARSGKTVIECVAVLLECLAYDGIAWGIGRKELTVLKRTVLLTLFKQMEFYGIGENDYNYNQQLNRIDFNNGSTIFLIDTAYKPSDPLNTRFGGFELTRCAVDESNETNEDVIIKLYERTGWRKNDTYNLKRKVFECFNPAKNHVYKRYFKPFRDGVQGMFKRFIAALPSDNPHPSVKEWIDDIIKTGDTVTIERQVNGNFDFDDDPRALCDFDAVTDMFTNDHVQGGTGYISADLAMKGRDKFIGGYWSGNICRVAIDMKQSTAREIELALKELKTVNKVGNSNIVADADGLGAYLESYIRNIKTFHGGGSPVDKAKFAKLKDECGYKLAELINKREIKIVCSKEQEDAIKEEVSICLKADSVNIDKKRLITKDAMKALLGRSPDYLDMLFMKMIFHTQPKRRAPRSNAPVKRHR
jgi:hypothetical protein